MSNIICISIPDGVCNNQHFQRPTRSEFQTQMKEVLRMAKERLRHKRRPRGPRMQPAAGERNRRRLWDDEQEANEADD